MEDTGDIWLPSGVGCYVICFWGSRYYSGGDGPMTIDANRQAQQSRRAKPAPTINVATQEELEQLRTLIDELQFRILTLEVANNAEIKEINHINAWLNDFRGRYHVLFNLPWYRLWMWARPSMGLPHYPQREKLRGIRIRDTKPRLPK